MATARASPSEACRRASPMSALFAAERFGFRIPSSRMSRFLQLLVSHGFLILLLVILADDSTLTSSTMTEPKLSKVRSMIISRNSLLTFLR